MSFSNSIREPEALTFKLVIHDVENLISLV